MPGRSQSTWERASSIGASPDASSLAAAVAAVRPLQLHFEVVPAAGDEVPWIDSSAMLQPASGALAQLLRHFAAIGCAPSQKAASASLMLRIGWAAGFAIGAYLTAHLVPRVRDYALRFSPRGFLSGLDVQSATFPHLPEHRSDGSDGAPPVSQDALRAILLDSLIGFTEPVLAAQHRWSRFSRYALWSMVVSSWAEQFVSLARQLGAQERGAREAQAMFALNAEIAAAAPELYEVQAGDRVGTCQRRAACCLYYRSPRRHFCASCPIISRDERLERNRDWVAAQSLPRPVLSPL